MLHCLKKNKVDFISKDGNTAGVTMTPTEDVSDVYRTLPVGCLRRTTLTSLCIYLDPQNPVVSDSGYCKDYRGLGQMFGLKPVFLKYCEDKDNRTERVIDEWCKQNDNASLGTLLDYIKEIERYDVITDCSCLIVEDAKKWLKQKQQAKEVQTPTQRPDWVLTIHDVEPNHKQMYSCCLCATDDDMWLTDLIKAMFEDIDDVMFFCPPDDIMGGKYEHDTTARVIQERCGGRVIFFISESFHSSKDYPAYNFCLQYSKAHDPDAKKGLLIPFILTNQAELIPSVLFGIAGIRWFRQRMRRAAWKTLARFVAWGDSRILEIEQLVEKKIDSNPEKWLASTPPSGTMSPSHCPSIANTNGGLAISGSGNTGSECRNTSPVSCLYSRNGTVNKKTCNNVNRKNPSNETVMCNGTPSSASVSVQPQKTFNFFRRFFGRNGTQSKEKQSKSVNESHSKIVEKESPVK